MEVKNELAVREDLAAIHQIAVLNGHHEGIDNHFTMMVPGYDDRFYLLPFGIHWAEVTPEDFMIVDFNGKVLQGDGEVEPTALHIHAPIHKSLPDAKCVLHTHMPFATALALLEVPELLMVSQNASRYYKSVAYDQEYNGLVLDSTEGKRLAALIGENRVLFLSNHGVIVLGKTVAQAYEDLYFLERACQVQILAQSTGQKLNPIELDVLEALKGQMVSDSYENNRRAELLLLAYKRLLKKEISKI
ncbi:MAG: aldolase [Bacteroidota bacterium]